MNPDDPATDGTLVSTEGPRLKRDPSEQPITPPPYSTPATVAELAAKAPPRDLLVKMAPPPAPEILRAYYLKPGHPSDSQKRVWTAARVSLDRDTPEDTLVFDFFCRGDRWPAAFREAVLNYLPLALTIEQRLAALHDRKRAQWAAQRVEHLAKKEASKVRAKAKREAAKLARVARATPAT